MSSKVQDFYERSAKKGWWHIQRLDSTGPNELEQDPQFRSLLPGDV